MLQIERTLFEDTVKTLNNYYAEAEKISSQSYMEGCLACVSAYIIFLCMETRYEKVSRCSSFNAFIRQSAVTIFLLKPLHIARFDERETSVIQSLQCFVKIEFSFDILPHSSMTTHVFRGADGNCL